MGATEARCQKEETTEENVAVEKPPCWICLCAGCQPQDCPSPDAPAKREERLQKRRKNVAEVKAKLPYLVHMTKIRKGQRSKSRIPMTPRAEDIHNIPMRKWKHDLLQWDKQLKQKYFPRGDFPIVKRSVVVKNTFLEVKDEPEDSQPVGGNPPKRQYRRAVTDS